MKLECSGQNSFYRTASFALFMFIPMITYDRYYLYTSAFICRRKRAYAYMFVFIQSVEEKVYRGKTRDREQYSLLNRKSNLEQILLHFIFVSSINIIFKLMISLNKCHAVINMLLILRDNGQQYILFYNLILFRHIRRGIREISLKKRLNSFARIRMNGIKFSRSCMVCMFYPIG